VNSGDQSKLAAGTKILFGVIIPHCGLVLIAILVARSFPSGAAGGFSELGFVSAAAMLIAISFVLDTCLIGFLSFKERTPATMVGCIIPVVCLLLLVSSRR